ncbi:MAG: ATP-binding cassette domain-containing protein, partial [Chitinophagaceae bacterium]
MNPNESMRIEQLCIRFPGTPETIALLHLSLSLEKGKTLAIVGESGSGKSMTALALMGLLPPNAIWSGKIQFQSDKNIVSITQNSSKQSWHEVRGRLASMVFQDPMTALNPVMKIGHQLREAIKAQHKISSRKAKALTLEWLEKVKLPTPKKLYHRYPHQISGGQKQRVVIAMA